MALTERRAGDAIRRVGIVFSGGPAPAANAVISAAAISFLEDGREVVGFFHGYTNLQEYHPVTHRLLPDEHYRVFTEKDVRGIRNERGIVIGTARANPGAKIKGPSDFDDPEKTARLRHVYEALVDLQIDALISIGGDDTLKTANFLKLYQDRLPPEARRVRIVHLPKTIDNDYHGIDFTFGFFTSVDFMAKSVLNLAADAEATSACFLVETMGRKAGWLSYGVGIAGEASLVVAVEDVGPEWRDERGHLLVDRVADHIVDVLLAREQRGAHWAVIVLAEGLAEMLPPGFLDGVARDEHGHVSLGTVNLGRAMSSVVTARYQARTGRKKKVTGVQLGYESRCAAPHAYDVMLGSQLGIGAYRALVEEGLDGHMVSVSGQLDLRYVPFQELVDPETLVTQVRFVQPGSDFHHLARFLETRTGKLPAFSLGPRRET
ncbi:MAG: 6-phosphofructokinase [Alphaproteobacteria bacterium]|nr:6-phosphofructokinase [Alphaproteobacteria bacterium]MCB9699224.1 6-phosphofructokinase [Alphaproteobacteria bacterium]